VYKIFYQKKLTIRGKKLAVILLRPIDKMINATSYQWQILQSRCVIWWTSQFNPCTSDFYPNV